MAWSGTTIATFNGSATAVVWDNATVKRMFPGCGDYPCVQFSNGDNANGAWTTYGALQIGGAISAGGYIAVQASKSVGGNGRLNYTVTAT